MSAKSRSKADEEVRELVTVVIKEARESLDQDKRVLKDNIALKAEINRLRAKYDSLQSELNGAIQGRIEVEKVLEATRKERDMRRRR